MMEEWGGNGGIIMMFKVKDLGIEKGKREKIEGGMKKIEDKILVEDLVIYGEKGMEVGK